MLCSAVILNLTNLLVQLFGRTVIFVFLGFTLVNRKNQPNDQPLRALLSSQELLAPFHLYFVFQPKEGGAGEQIVFVLCHVTKQPWRLA